MSETPIYDRLMREASRRHVLVTVRRNALSWDFGGYGGAITNISFSEAMSTGRRIAIDFLIRTKIISG